MTLPGESNPRGGINAEQGKAMADAIAVLKQQGAVIVDPAEIPSFVAKTANDSFPLWDFCSGGEHAKGKDQNCSINFKYGMKRDYNAWLATLGASAPVKSLKEHIEWNRAHAKAGAIKYGQSRFEISDEIDLVADKARLDADDAKDYRLSRDQGIDGVLKAHKLDAFITPGGSGAGIAARAGYPIVAVPFAHGAERAAAALPRRIQRQARAIRCWIRRRAVQRAATDRDRVRVRAGDEEARAAFISALRNNK